jgi:hypothetical protein
MPEWLTVKVPRMLYLPVVTGEGFNNSGMRIEPRVQLRDDDGNLIDSWTGDELQLLPGSNQIRINGVDHKMLISCDKLNIDPQGFIQLSKPRPPAALSSGGIGKASVGGMGVAVRKARDTAWDHDAAREWEGDAGTSAAPFRFQKPKKTAAHSNQTANTRRADFAPVPEGGFPPGFDESDEAFIEAFGNDFAAHMAAGDPDNEIRDVTLRDGSIAQARFDKKTGRQIGATFRQYQANNDEGGQSVGYSGKNSTFDEAEYRRRLAEQNQHATPAPTARERAEADERRAPRPPTPLRAVPAAPSYPYGWTTTGAIHLDQLIGNKNPDLQGWPLGKVSYLFGLRPITDLMVEVTRGHIAADIPAAFGAVHLIKQGQPLVYIHLPLIASSQFRLSLAEELPALVEMVNGMKVAVVLVSGDYKEETPALLNFMPDVRVLVEPHASDERFITARIKKNNLNPNTTNQAVSFPRPDPNP